MKYMTWNCDHTLKYDSKTQTKFLHHFHKNPIFTPFSDLLNNLIWSTKIFSHILRENIHFYVPENEKNQNWFFEQFGWFSRVGSHIESFTFWTRFARVIRCAQRKDIWLKTGDRDGEFGPRNCLFNNELRSSKGKLILWNLKHPTAVLQYDWEVALYLTPGATSNNQCEYFLGHLSFWFIIAVRCAYVKVSFSTFCRRRTVSYILEKENRTVSVENLVPKFLFNNSFFTKKKKN